MLALLLWLTGGPARADGLVQYRVGYTLKAPGVVSVSLTLEPAVSGPAPLVIPRTYPGGYAQVPYDAFISHVTARGRDGRPLNIVRDDDGPRWVIGTTGDAIASIEYVVDIAGMESAVLDAVSTSKRRPGYVALLGYSVFGYLDGCTGRRTHLHVEGPSRWPVLATLHPELPAPVGAADADAADYYDLADSQILLGPKLQITKLDGPIGLYLAVYAEGPLDTALEGRLARAALNDVQAYFGDTPIGDYTVQLELLNPVAGHHYGFSQEHVASGTFALPIQAAVGAGSSARDLARVRFNFAHHMAHSWIPKRAYGEGYRPFNWEMAPVIDTIWFNEGFGRYAAIAATAAAMPVEEARAFRASQLGALRRIVDSAPPFIRGMSLPMLSREASFLYAADFRTGQNVFARGALMAAEIDDRIQAQSGGGKSLRDALRGLLAWSAEHRAPFATEQLGDLFSNATGVPVADIIARWQRPLDTR